MSAGIKTAFLLGLAFALGLLGAMLGDVIR